MKNTSLCSLKSVIATLVLACIVSLAAHAGVTVTATKPNVKVGDSITLTATSTSTRDTRFTWWVSRPALLKLSATGKTAGAKGLAAGTVEVFARGNVTRSTGSVTLAVASTSLTTSHAGRFTVYEGSKTCRRCHPNQAAEVHGSVHYQWNGPTPNVVNMTSGGKMHGMNDFCTNPSLGFISILTNLQGQQVSGGCAQCHVGMGAKPTSQVSTEQLDNIDCLICHSKNYKRKVVKLADGSFKFAPDESKMTVPLLQAITDIQRSSNDTCINCHAYAGGGQNNKRGDIEEAHRNAGRDFDVHLAPKSVGGAGLKCVSCHTFTKHHVAGRGVDMRTTDSSVTVRCDKCHTTAPHGNTRLDQHAARINCTVCHIPAFARGSTTDMYRDFSGVEIDAVKQLYEPAITRKGNVVPEYEFFDGISWIYDLGMPAFTDAATGEILTAAPVADINSPGAKINAFKIHRANQPMDPVTTKLLPLKMGLLFQKGNPDQAIRAAATELGWPLPQGYTYVETKRYMGIFHEVAPAERALGCADCHGGTRMDFPALGYTPKSQRNGRPLCASCHEDETDEWPTEFFKKVHEKHVTDKKLNCSECHSFARAW